MAGWVLLNIEAPGLLGSLDSCRVASYSDDLTLMKFSLPTPDGKYKWQLNHVAIPSDSRSILCRMVQWFGAINSWPSFRYNSPTCQNSIVRR